MGNRMVGFDIGEREVKMVYTAGGKIKKTVSVPLPDNLVENGVIKSMDAMADFLRLSAKENGIPRTGAAVALPDALVFSRNVQLPAMTANQLAYNLPYEFKDYLSLEKEKYFYDYAIYGIEEGEEGCTMELFACAVLKSTIADYRAMFRRAGFKLKLAVPEEWAYVSALRQAGQTEGTYCLADLGHAQSRVHILADGRSASRRVMEVGIANVEQQIAEDHLVDIHMARAYKLNNHGGALNAQSCTRIYERLGIEILKTVNFYNYNNREVAVQSVYLCGGGAAIEPLREAIAKVTNLEICSLDQLLPELEGREVYLKAFGCAVGK